MTFEEELSKANTNHFFREFTFSKNQFKPNPQSELELADSVIYLDDLLIVFQVKEREALPDTTPEQEKKWFKQQVLNRATRQIRDTLRYLKTYPVVEVTNGWGHVFNIAAAEIKKFCKVVLYDGNPSLPESLASTRFHESSTAGIIHVFDSSDYLAMLRTLITPVEVADYLLFRERIINRWGEAVSAVSEKALVGQYLRNLPDVHPSSMFEVLVDKLIQKETEEWDILRIIHLFAERRNTPQKSPTDYYDTLTELAKLNRTDMRLFKERFRMAMDNANADQDVRPYRFVASTGCGFLFIPCPRPLETRRVVMLRALSELNKYDLKLERCVGLSFLSEGNESWCDVQWYRVVYPWKENPEADKVLKEHVPFRPIKTSVVERYGLVDEINI